MRTKTTILSAVALAAGLLSSHAQVYSANIVGYVNRPLVNAFNDVCTPLDANGSNSGSNVFVNVAGSLDGCEVRVWTGSTFIAYFIDSSAPINGWTDSNGSDTPAPDLSPGKGYLFVNAVGLTNYTFVGTVHNAGSSPGVTISNWMALASPPKVANNLIGSITPVGGGISSVLGLTNTVVAGVGDRDGDAFQIPTITVTAGSGALSSYLVRYFDSSVPAPYITDANSVAIPEPQITITHPILYQGQAASPPWIQKVP